MGINQSVLNKYLFLTLCVCTLLLTGNMSRLFGSSFVPLQLTEQQSGQANLGLWQEQSGGIFVMNPFNLNGYYALKEYLGKVTDKRIISFEVFHGRAKVVLEEA
ncbi:MAG: hypothetical protein PHF25_05725 [Candidatus Margulisbacteria bacterium]|nr:hypothetical protein [Candidatus Margulisiibacteriota bacterium]